jgi:hypothetical protein
MEKCWRNDRTTLRGSALKNEHTVYILRHHIRELRRCYQYVGPALQIIALGGTRDSSQDACRRDTDTALFSCDSEKPPAIVRLTIPIGIVTSGDFASMSRLCAFLLAVRLPAAPTRRERLPVRSSSRRARTVSAPSCRATRLLVVELECASGDADSPAHGPAARELTERIEVDRSTAVESAYLVYASERGYEASMKTVETAALPAPDALVAICGSELYQRGYRSPDPLWDQMLRRDWDPKPAKWVVGKFFADDLTEDKSTAEEYELVFNVKEDASAPAVELRDKVHSKLGEMGIKARVSLRGGSEGSLAIMPASGDIGKVVAFCAKMLKIDSPGSTCVFGHAGFVDSCVGSSETALGVVAAGDSLPATLQPASQNGRIYVSQHKGVPALLDGVMHHAVL